MGSASERAGLYQEPLVRQRATALAQTEQVVRELGDEELLRVVPGHLARLLRERLAQVGGEARRELARAAYEALEGVLGEGARLEGTAPKLPFLDGVKPLPEAPALAFDEDGLIVNDDHHPDLATLLCGELPSAARVDLVCAFIRWEGLRLLVDAIEAHTGAGRALRVLTTTYMGVTEQRALDRLVEAGAQIQVCYETHATRLHAKAWLFHRPHLGSTVYVGSSNLSRSALTDGMEWNVRLSERTSAAVVARFRGLFESYWRQRLFEPYAPDRFARAIAAWARPTAHAPGLGVAQDEVIDEAPVYVPLPHQREVLDTLRKERARHGRHRNLVVAATGTGKTVIAAFDFARYRQAHPQATLLFVAHRHDLLAQARRTFAAVLGDPSFGELLVRGERPTRWQHVFASIQSLGPELAGRAPDHFDVVIFDECHHAAAQSYDRALAHLQPRELLGLTATPERADGASILEAFGGRISAEIRLWDALEQHLLAPFHYFGLSDGTDLSGVAWSRSGYDVNALEALYTADDVRVRLVDRELRRLVAAPERMRALGFCVSVEHARFMADRFCALGYRAIALHGGSPPDERDAAPGRLERGELQVIFTVDIYNEGVDIPSVDTLLMLRPTESATIFLQQLGRGLRHAPDKHCVTVLDFIGHAHASFRFDQRLCRLLGTSREGLKKHLNGERPAHLPPGCAFTLDARARDEILSALQQHITESFASVASTLRTYPQGTTLLEFADAEALDLDALYRTKSWSWGKLRARAGHLERDPYTEAFTQAIAERVHRLTHLDDSARLDLYRALFKDPKTRAQIHLDSLYTKRLATMLCNELWQPQRAPQDLEEAITSLRQDAALCEELLQLLDALEARAPHVTTPLRELGDPHLHDIPLAVHGTYTRAEILAAFGVLGLGESSSLREGVYYEPRTRCDLLFVTLDKSSDAYDPQLMYRDYPIDLRTFHWESQNQTSASTPTGARYIDPDREGCAMLFIRHKDKVAGRAQPFIFLGPADHVSHQGDRPMAIIWRLRVELPHRIFSEALQALDT